ncbi:4-alpha-glucanotransferase [Powellomyces hirtus]|uniref:4-alpha-glucanotransferase n=1 Tax=Powellomyces hirtus TaxID=109895 RepID=A0A507DXV6_9FUNG|nr:4-alpha-glucanotransferase [Powellomyces hirtus]
MPSTRSHDMRQPSVALAPLPGRCSGVLLHVTSLPTDYGIGDVGPAAINFLDWLHKAGQTLWQFLPLNPHGHAGSPYGTPSALAANPAIVSLVPLLGAGLLKADDVKELLSVPKGKVDYDRITPLKRRLLRLARDRFREGNISHPSIEGWDEKFDEFVRREGPSWLDDYALFTALREKHGKCWVDWPVELRDRKASAMNKARKELEDDIDEHLFNQFLFDIQWSAVRKHAEKLGIRLVGDIPIFVAYDSADVWAHRQMFKLDKDGKQLAQAGVPPDYFSATGQLWGNPVYDWTAIAKDGYKWWTLRCQRMLALSDIIRIDHFRGFEAAWEVPADHTTAMNGKWVKGPGTAVFKAVDKALGGRMPVIAEDLGVITAEVNAIRDEMGYPGMKVLQFAWGGESKYDPRGDHLPHNLKSHHCVYYTGTHDNNTARGWAEQASASERKAVRRYLGRSAPGQDLDAPGGKRKRVEGASMVSEKLEAGAEDDAREIIETASWDFIRIAFSSVADMAILQLQDALDLGTDCRMNLPATVDNNWSWRALDGQMTDDIAAKLRSFTEFYGREPATKI